MPGQRRKPSSFLSIEALDERVRDLELGSGVRPSATRPTPVATTAPRYAEAIVAASDSSELMKAVADYVCTGVDDDLVIQAALDAVAAGPWGGRVLLAAGLFELSDALAVDGNITLAGQGRGTFVRNASGDTIVIAGADDVTIQDMSIHSGSDYAVSVFGAVRRCIISGVFTDAPIQLDENAVVSDSVIAGLEFYGDSSIAHGCRFVGPLLLDGASARNLVVACSVDLPGSVVLDGTDNKIDGCQIRGHVTPDNTAQLVSVAGTRNGFTNNTVRSSSSVTRYAYGVRVAVGATGARVKFNDLRSGAGTWGTAAYLDSGTGTLASDNDT